MISERNDPDEDEMGNKIRKKRKVVVKNDTLTVDEEDYRVIADMACDQLLHDGRAEYMRFNVNDNNRIETLEIQRYKLHGVFFRLSKLSALKVLVGHCWEVTSLCSSIGLLQNLEDLELNGYQLKISQMRLGI